MKFINKNASHDKSNYENQMNKSTEKNINYIDKIHNKCQIGSFLDFLSDLKFEPKRQIVKQ